jgi:hypothetical protein
LFLGWRGKRSRQGLSGRCVYASACVCLNQMANLVEGCTGQKERN